jgi:arginase
MNQHCILVGAPVDSGQSNPGCLMGPASYRVAGLAGTLSELGCSVEDRGDVAPRVPGAGTCTNQAVHHLGETISWTQALADAAEHAMAAGFPIFLGGDHSLSLGTVAGVAAHARKHARPLFVLWLDAHSDFHTPMTTRSGNLHGTPVAYLAGLADFEAFPAFPDPVPADRICLFGIRSVDPDERTALRGHGITPVDMRELDERGFVAPLSAFLDQVRGGRRAAARLARRRFSRSLDRAGGRHHGARRRDLPRGASGHGDAARERAGEFARPGRAQPVPRRARQDRPADGRPHRQPDGPQGASTASTAAL